MPEVKPKLPCPPWQVPTLAVWARDTPSHSLPRRPGQGCIPAVPIGLQLDTLGRVGVTGGTDTADITAGALEGGAGLATFLFEKDCGPGRGGSSGSLPSLVLSSSQLQFLFSYLPRCPVAARRGCMALPKWTQGLGAGSWSWRGVAATWDDGTCAHAQEPMFGFYLQSCDFAPAGTQAAGKGHLGSSVHTHMHTPPWSARAHTFVRVSRVWHLCRP